MAGFVTETSTMQTASKHVSDVNAQVTALLSSLQAEVATAPTHFKGASAATFNQLMASYDASAKKLNTALQGIADEIAQSGQAYAAQDESRSAALKSSGSGLNL